MASGAFPLTSPKAWLHSLPARLAWLVAYVLAGALALHAFTLGTAHDIHLLCPAAGIALAALLLGGRGYLPIVLLGAWLLHLYEGRGWSTAALIAIGCTAGAEFSRWFLTGKERFDAQFRHPRDFFSLAVAASLGSAWSGVIAALTLQGIGSIDAWLSAMLHWWQGDVLGILLCTPLCLALHAWWAKRSPPTWADVRDFVGGMAVLALIASLTFWNDKVEVAWGLMSFCLTLLLVLWAAIRFEQLGALLATTIAVLQTLLSVHLAHVALENAPLDQHGIFFWVRATTLVIVGLSVLSLMAHRRSIETAARNSAAAMETILKTSIDGFWKTDAEGRLLEVNPAYCHMSGYTREELLQMRILDLEAIENTAATAQHIEKLMREGRDLFETCHRRKDGTVWNVEISTIVHRSDAFYLFVFLRDITERTQFQMQLAKHEAMLSRTEGIAHVGSWEWHVGSDTVTWSQEMFRLFQIDPAEGAPPFAEHGRVFSDASMQKLREVIDRAMHDHLPFELELEIRRPDGQHRFCLGRGFVHTDAEGKVDRLYGSMQDIHDQKERENQVHRLAFYDPLTQLPNRRLLSEALAQAMTSSQRSRRHCAVLLLDLDNFKPLNDHYGHLAGDALLVEASRRISACVRATDTVARLGGDEFVVLLTDLDEEHAYSVSQAEHIARKIGHSLSVPYFLTIDTHNTQTIEHHGSVSIGITLFLGSSFNQDDILHNADTAMYRAKAAGRNAIALDHGTPNPSHAA